MPGKFWGKRNGEPEAGKLNKAEELSGACVAGPYLENKANNLYFSQKCAAEEGAWKGRGGGIRQHSVEIVLKLLGQQGGREEEKRRVKRDEPSNQAANQQRRQVLPRNYRKRRAKERGDFWSSSVPGYAAEELKRQKQNLPARRVWKAEKAL